MQIFLNRIFVFTLTLVFSLLITGKITRLFLFKSVYSNEKAYLGKSVSYIFLGDSHAMCAFNDSIIKNSFNASRNSETYFQTYNKLNWILKANPQIELVILSFAPHNMSRLQDNLILYGERYFPILDSGSKKIMKQAGPNGLLPNSSGIITTFYTLTHFIKYSYLNFKWNWGLPGNLQIYWQYLTEPSGTLTKAYFHPVFTSRYSSSHSNLNIQSTRVTVQRHFGDKPSECKSSKIMIKYLIKICDLCQDQNLKLILVNTPLHNSYFEQIPETLNNKYMVLADSIVQRYNNVRFVDLRNYPLSDSDFGDSDHLNSLGNKSFSGAVQNLIKEFSGI